MSNEPKTLPDDTHGYDPGGGPVMCAALLGVAVGAGLAILFAPASGRDLRTELTARARRRYDEASEVLERGRTAVEQTRAHVSKVAAEGRETIADLRARKERTLETLGHEAAAAVADVRAAFRGARNNGDAV
ncbi:MAG TPA: YtxH domain-containing protein [Vicinamibacterales bacterium]|nr:YtxH domain-containing protein [Vicinamibacterales bacterium]